MKLKIFTSIFFSALISNSVVAADQLGSRNNPLKIAIVPSGHATKALDSAKPVAKCIEDKSKIFINIQVPNSYIAVVEAIGAQKVDLAFGDIVSFLIAKNKFGAEPLLQVIRYGTTTYQSAIFVKSTSSINEIKDLEGKKFAFSDASSASSYIYPKILMKKNNKKFAQEVPTGSMDASIIALMQGQVDAAAAYYNPPPISAKEKDGKSEKINDARNKVINIYPNIAKETKVLWLSKPIPNEPVYARKGLSEDLKAKLVPAIAECIKSYPNSINNMQELIPLKKNSTDYDEFVKEVETSGLDIANIFSKK
ncbi:phosphate/phosphite/phosphonate ABC transporter substrate-binding protein [Pigmentibacter sp. JX0631]|uniref:phosphate/phosphite/phosphonate ABC transporter substrate-binding protein n=1 Tax=Pigmentibacter sp. JX0631 TaxID=2976982 RepID=UPI002469C353|nr:phosphate/phosphite/phosphonate ABC transporter substrate-binding protein [Pigmentibacter sp. JX0631]WGL60876.1 phosphate/phosphite/phosphonate ABC transporter substrate-binding protein [Pigmentibacter sp. JX0631]